MCLITTCCFNRIKLMELIQTVENKFEISARNNGWSAFSDRQESVLERQATIFTDHVDRQQNSFRYPSIRCC